MHIPGVTHFFRVNLFCRDVWASCGQPESLLGPSNKMAANSPSSWEKHEDDKQKQQFLPFGESEGAKRVNEDQEMKDDLQEHLQIDKIEELRRYLKC